MRGLLITFEGIDGCGKTTQAELFLQKLTGSELPALLVREPGGTQVGEEIRSILLNNRLSISLQAELLLYMAARAEICDQVIRPALRSGKIVVGDRFTDSTLAYQGYGGGASLQVIDQLNQTATGGIKPDLTLLFDLAIEKAAARRGIETDRMENKAASYHQRVRDGYCDLAGLEPQRIKVINAELSIDDQHRLVWSFVAPLLAMHNTMRLS